MNTTGSTSRKSVTFKMGFAEVLTVVFVTLKLTDVIDWSWWLVFSPIIIAWGVALILVGLVAALK